jgi:signal transduction histidine kinase
MSSELVAIVFFSEIDHLQVDQRTATNLFRSYQEKLQSLVLSGATEIVGSLGLENNQLVLNIYDNAGGTVGKENRSIEEVAIKERVRSIKGHSEIHTLSKEESNFTISIPYQSDLTELENFNSDRKAN